MFGDAQVDAKEARGIGEATGLDAYSQEVRDEIAAVRKIVCDLHAELPRWELVVWTAGNVSQLSDTNDLADAFLDVAEKASVQGASVNGFLARPGLNWKLRGLKDQQGAYVFGAPTEGGGTGFPDRLSSQCAHSVHQEPSALVARSSHSSPS